MYHWIIPLFAAVASLALCILVNRAKGHTELGKVFTFLATTLVLWNLNFFVLYSVADRNAAFQLTRLFRVGSIFLAPAVLHLVFALDCQRPRVWRVGLIAAYGGACVLTVANFLDLMVSGLQRYAWGYYWMGGPFYNMFAFLIVVDFSAVLAILVGDYRTTTESRMRLQLKFWLLGAALALPLGSTNLLPAYGIPVYPLGNLCSVAWAGVVAYAIIRHRLMDINVVVTKGMAYAAVSLLVIVPAFVAMLWLQRHAFGHLHAGFSFTVLVMLLAVAVIFPALRLRAESRIERSLFRERHEYRLALAAFTRSIVRILDRDRLIAELAATLSKTWGLDRIVIGMLDPAKRAFTMLHWGSGPTPPAEFSEHNAFICVLARRQEVALREELEASASNVAEGRVVAAICQEHGWEVCIPLSAGAKLIGFIGLGRKRNLDAFFAEDLELLGTLSAEASVALENARLYDELKRSQEIIHRADRLSALGTLAAGIAHEVRNPLVSIQTFFQLAPERLHDEEFFTTFLGIAAGEVKRIADLIAELLSFARSPARTLGAVNLNEIAERVARLLEPEARKRRLVFRRALSPDLPAVFADGDQIKQVLINLVLNSIEATEPGGEVSLCSSVVEYDSGLVSRLEVHDTGIGIPKGYIEEIFNPFFTTKDKGTGLGLAIAHQIIAEHGGSIAVESEEGRGARFLIDLPVYAEGVYVGHSHALSAITEPFPDGYVARGKVSS